MEEIKYRLDSFEGPLDLLLTLIQKNKVSIENIPISLICDQYMEYLNEAETLNMDIATEFLVMASELMLIKSKMLLPKPDTDEEDPRSTLADALLRYQQAKEAAAKFAPMYAYYSGRMVKDTDEISIDKTFVTDQQVEDLCLAVRRIITYNEAIEKAKSFGFDLNGAVMASDAFFPFPDCVEIAGNEGITAVIQPGGSVKDELSFQYCNEHGIAMVTTGFRHFKH